MCYQSPAGPPVILPTLFGVGSSVMVVHLDSVVVFTSNIHMKTCEVDPIGGIHGMFGIICD